VPGAGGVPADQLVEVAGRGTPDQRGPLDLSAGGPGELGLVQRQHVGRGQPQPGTGRLPDPLDRRPGVLGGRRHEEDREFLAAGRRIRYAARRDQPGPDPVERADVLDLVAVVLLAVDDDQFLGPAGDRHLAVHDERLVAGVEPAVRRERLGVGLRVVQIARRDPVGAYLESADRRRRQRPVVVVGDPDPIAGRRPAHAEELDAVVVGHLRPGEVQRTVQARLADPQVAARGGEELGGGRGGGLGHPPHVDHRLGAYAEPRGAGQELPDDRRRALLAGVQHGPDAGQIPLPVRHVAQRVGDQAVAEVRRPGVRHAVALQGVQPAQRRLGDPGGRRVQAVAAEHGVPQQEHHHRRDVVERQPVQAGLAGPDQVDLPAGERVADDRPVRHLDDLRLPGAARGERAHRHVLRLRGVYRVLRRVPQQFGDGHRGRAGLLVELADCG
jgi:hypothetical protein